MGEDSIISEYGYFSFSTSSPTYPQDYNDTMNWILAKQAGYKSHAEHMRAVDQQRSEKLASYLERHYDGVAAEPIGPVPTARKLFSTASPAALALR